MGILRPSTGHTLDLDHRGEAIRCALIDTIETRHGWVAVPDAVWQAQPAQQAVDEMFVGTAVDVDHASPSVSPAYLNVNHNDLFRQRAKPASASRIVLCP